MIDIIKTLSNHYTENMGARDFAEFTWSYTKLY